MNNTCILCPHFFELFMMYDVYWYCQMKKKRMIMKILKKEWFIWKFWKRGEEETKSMPHAPVNKVNNKITEHRAIFQRERQQTDKISQQPENWENRNGPDCKSTCLFIQNIITLSPLIIHIPLMRIFCCYSHNLFTFLW